jgi:hypothetical protein
VAGSPRDLNLAGCGEEYGRTDGGDGARVLAARPWTGSPRRGRRRSWQRRGPPPPPRTSRLRAGQQGRRPAALEREEVTGWVVMCVCG